MKLSINIRNWGAQSTPAIMLECAKAADESGLDTLWLNEHLAIPPKADMPDRVPAGFSEGRFLDPMATLAFLAASTKRIGLGTAVLLLPYRLPMQTAKLVATIQELSAGRLRLGVGVGWMKEEFTVLGVDRSRRGAISDEVLALLQDCFLPMTLLSITVSRFCFSLDRHLRRSMLVARHRMVQSAPLNMVTAGFQPGSNPRRSKLTSQNFTRCAEKPVVQRLKSLR